MPTPSVWRCIIRELRIHTALPVWVTWADQGQARRELACTLDVSRKGARLASVKGLQEAGQRIALRRKTSEARFRVVWIGPPRTPYEGQVGVECIEPDKMIWDIDFELAHEDFEPIQGTPRGATQLQETAKAKSQSYGCAGTARVWTSELGNEYTEGRLTAIGILGAQLDIDMNDRMLSKDEVLLQVQVDEAQLTFKGIVCAKESASGAWVEFQQIRRGDRQVLQALIARLSRQKGNMPNRLS